MCKYSTVFYKTPSQIGQCPTKVSMCLVAIRLELLAIRKKTQTSFYVYKWMCCTWIVFIAPSSDFKK